MQTVHGEGASILMYQINIYAQECITEQNTVVDRDTVCTELTHEINDALLDLFSMKRVSVIQPIAYDTATAVGICRFSCVMDYNNYVYNS